MIEWLEHIDRDLLLAINQSHSPLLDKIMWVISEKYFGVPIYLLLLFLAYRNFGMKGMFVFLLVGGFCVGLSDITSKYLFKEVFMRYRPSHNIELKNQIHLVNNYKGGYYGFISNHSANMFALTTFSILCFFKPLKSNWIFLLLLFPITIAYSRVYLGVHYPSDVIVGAFWGSILGYLFYLIFVYLHSKFPSQSR